MKLGRGIDAVRDNGRNAILRLDNGYTGDYDHVLLATGYRSDIHRQNLIVPGLLARIRHEDGSPILNRDAESSVPGLHFIGSSAVHAFGPIMRSAGAAVPPVCPLLFGSSALLLLLRCCSLWRSTEPAAVGGGRRNAGSMQFRHCARHRRRRRPEITMSFLALEHLAS